MTDKTLVEVNDSDLKAIESAIAVIKASVSSFGGTDPELLDHLVPLKALKKRIIAAQTAV